MFRRQLMLLTLLGCWSAPLQAQAPHNRVDPPPPRTEITTDPQEAWSAVQIREMESLFAEGEYDKAVTVNNELRRRLGEMPPEDQARTLIMRARLDLAYGDEAKFSRWIDQAFSIFPQFELDPVKDPPQLINQWQGLLANKAAQAETVAKPAPPATTAKPAVTQESNTSEGLFWPGLLPFGLGHFDAGEYKDGGFFLTSQLLVFVTGVNYGAEPDEGEPTGWARPANSPGEVFAGTMFLGLYGYEMLDLVPELYDRDSNKAAGLRTTLSMFPLGVAQAKNGHYYKALSVGGFQAICLTAVMMAPEERERQMALGLFGAAWAYSIFDGFIYHSDSYDPRPTSAQAMVLPIFQGDQVGAQLSAQWMLD